MGKKKPNSKKTVETLTHDEASGKNIPTAEYQSVMAKEQQTPIRVAYERRNRDLDPQLVWRGKEEQDWSDLVISASGFAVLDLTFLDEILQRYGIANLWAAMGWFLERFRESFHVPEEFLNRMEQHRPRSPHYLERNRRGGVLASRWNLILPKELMRQEEWNEP
jgi:hypothetical protein